MNNGKKYFIIISPAYNEENIIAEFLTSIEKSLDYSLKHDLICKKIIICVNWCTDNTESIIREHRLFKEWKIQIIYSELWNQNANIALYSYVKQYYKEDYVLKLDSDVLININAISLLFREFNNNTNLLISWWHPIPNIDYNSNFFKDFIPKILAIKAFFYKSEISRYNVYKYHETQDNWINKSKIYFHWRIFLCRNIEYLFLESSQIGDDVFLAAYLYTHYWKKTIKIIYNANCIYTPYKSFSHYRRVYRRIYEDKKILANKSQYSRYIKESKTKLDWNYIMSQGNKIKGYFILYFLIIKTFEISFRVVKYKKKYRMYFKK